MKLINKAIKFFRDSWAEFKRMTWPTKDAIIGGTLIVIIFSGLLTLYIFVIDILISKLLSLIF